MDKPKVFISYSWSSQGHSNTIRLYAERLVSDGVDVILDQWDLKEGQDKYAFMEKMITDPSVTHVLIFSDSQYVEKANKREKGVGTESQIISKEVYDKVEQKKFIPIICEKDEKGEPILPVFFKTRIWIDFSTPEAATSSWEQLLRVLYNKPMYEKPSLGTPPSFLNDDASRPSLPTIGKFNMLKDALLNDKKTVALCRTDFLNTVIAYADASRTRSEPKVEHLDEKVLSDFHNLLPLRDQLVDWLLLETSLQPKEDFDTILIEFLESLLALKYRPSEVTSSWNDRWFDAHRLFVYEVFLYFIATLIKKGCDKTVHALLTTNYILPEPESYGRNFASFDVFRAHSGALEDRKNRLKLNRISLIADFVKERATRNDISFLEVMQAELVIFLMVMLADSYRWYPHTLVYSGIHGMRFPLFMRAVQHKYFVRLKTITGIATSDELRTKFVTSYNKNKIGQWEMVFHCDISFENSMYLDKLDTLD